MEESLGHYKERGQSLVEVLVALATIVVLLSTVTFMVLQSMNQASRSSDLTTATQHAQEGIEIAQARKGFQADEFYCLGSNNSFGTAQSQPCATPNVNQYIRQVSVANSLQCSPLLKLTVTVSWSDANCQNGEYCHAVPLTTCL